LDLIEEWLKGVSRSLKSRGLFIATFLLSNEDFPGKGWVYPECVSYGASTLVQCGRNAGLDLRILDWSHPRQTWGLFTPPTCDPPWFENQLLSWNNSIAAGLWDRTT
jgi:hypothetical protein